MTQHKLKALRESAGLTQVEVSQRAHVSCTRISLFENGLGVLSEVEESAVRQAILKLTAERSRSVLSSARKREVVNVTESKSSVAGEKKIMKTLEQELTEMRAELAAAKGQKDTATAKLKEGFISGGLSEADAEIAAAGPGKLHTVFEEAGRR
jgi:transcriptional regulator with XRE-family HTH domain